MPTSSSHFCIVGAGPAGVQMGHLMHKHNLDYVTFERGLRAATFFNKYPVHRKLNSYNRRHTRTSQPDFNLRHDWHTLLEQDSLPPFTTMTDEFWPAADTYVEYINKFAEPQVAAGKVRYCHTVTSIGKAGFDGDEAGGYDVRVRSVSPCTSASAWDGINVTAGESGLSKASKVSELTHHCKVLVMADGMWKPTPRAVVDPWMAGSHLALGYDSLRSYASSDFTDKRVLILGSGNAAFETADALRNYAADLVLLARTRVNRLADSRYVGGVRGPRTMSFDTGELKSLEAVVTHGLPSDDLEGFPQARYSLFRCGSARPFAGWPADEPANAKQAGGFDGKPPTCISEIDPDSGLVMIGWADRGHPTAESAMSLLSPAGLKVLPAPAWLRKLYRGVLGNTPAHLQAKVPSADGAEPPLEVMMMSEADLHNPALTTEQLDALAACGALTKGLNRRSYELGHGPWDVVISALGWIYDDAPFAAGGSVTIERTDLSGSGGMLGDLGRGVAKRKGVYPRLASTTHESVSAPNVYFVGANSHGIDRERYQASGGFVHGFRFTTRAVFRSLLQAYLDGGDGMTTTGRSPTPSASATSSLLRREGVSSFPLPAPLSPSASIFASASASPSASAHTGQLFGQLLEVPLWKRMLERVLFGAASYEMIGGSLVDAIVFDHAWGDGNRSVYVEEVTEDWLHAKYASYARVTTGHYAGGAASPQNGPLHSAVRLPEYAPTAQPFHAVIEFWPPTVKPPPPGASPAAAYGGTRPVIEEHPSSIWTPQRGSYRFHFKADRLTDFSSDAQAPVLANFLDDVAACVRAGEGCRGLARPYHELRDHISARDSGGSGSEAGLGTRLQRAVLFGLAMTALVALTSGRGADKEKSLAEGGGCGKVGAASTKGKSKSS